MNSGELIANGGNINLNATETGAGSATIYGTSQIEYSAGSSDNVTFASGSTGELLLLNSAAFKGTVTGFTGSGTGAPTTSDKMDLRDINYLSPNFSKNYANNILTVSDGSHTANINMVGSYTLANFHFAADGSNGTLVTDPPTTFDQGNSSSTTTPVTNTCTVADGATVELNSASTGQVSFAGLLGTGILQLDQSANFSGTVAGMVGRDTLDLRDINFSKIQKPIFSGDETSGILSVADGNHTANIQLLGNYIAAAFTTASDGHGGTFVETQPHPVVMLGTAHA